MDHEGRIQKVAARLFHLSLSFFIIMNRNSLDFRKAGRVVHGQLGFFGNAPSLMEFF